MKSKKILAAILILCLGGFIVYLLGAYITDLQKPEQTVLVAVAKNDVKEGSFLTTDDYSYVAIPASDAIYSYVTYQKKETINTDGSITETYFDPLKGKEVSQRLYAGERIVKGRINFSAENLMEEAEYNDAEYRRYTYNGSGLENFAGLLKSGDRIDIWIQYTVVDNEKGKADKIIVTDKIFSNVLISKVLDANGNEVTASTGAASILELMMKEKDLQEFITWRAVGKITLVKSSASTDTETSKVDRIKLSLSELTDSVTSSPDGSSIISNIDVIRGSGDGYQIDLNESDAANDR